MGGGGGINFWNVCKTQHFQFHPDLGGGGIFVGCAYKAQHSILIFMPKFWGWKHIYGMCIRPKIFNSIPRFVQNICGVETYFWHILIVMQNILNRGYKHFSGMCIKNFQFYSEIRAKHLGGNKFPACV